MPTGTLTKKIHCQREELGEDAAEQQADRAAAGRDRAQTPSAFVRSAPFRERRRDDRERGGGDERGAEALQRRGRRSASPTTVARPLSSEAAVKTTTPARKMRLRPEEVAGAAAEQQEAAEDERVGVDDPLQVGVGDAEVGLDRRQRDVHDRRVEDDHELREADEDEDEPGVLVRRHTSTLPVPLKLRGTGNRTIGRRRPSAC